jgi:hypothetical protein
MPGTRPGMTWKGWRLWLELPLQLITYPAMKLELRLL